VPQAAHVGERANERLKKSIEAIDLLSQQEREVVASINQFLIPFSKKRLALMLEEGFLLSTLS